MKINFPLTAEANVNIYGDGGHGSRPQLLPSDEELAEIERQRKAEEILLEKNKVKTKPANKKDADEDGGDVGDEDEDAEDDADDESDDGDGDGDDAGDESDDGEEEDEDDEATAGAVSGTRKIRRVAIAADGGYNNVFSGFPGVGKSTVFKNTRDGLVVADSDSSTFDKAQFPGNYMTHIEETRPSVDVLMVSSHNVVRDALVERNIPFHLVYPSADQKAEYMERYRKRGSPQPFLDLMNKNWDTFIAECSAQTGCEHIVLQPGQYLGDVIQDYL